jgi:hypothetical protein
MSYIEHLPDDLLLSILDSRCNDIEEEIRILEINTEYCNDVINDVDADESYYSSTEDEEDEEDDEFLQQQHDDAVWLANQNLNMNFNDFINMNI